MDELTDEQPAPPPEGEHTRSPHRKIFQFVFTVAVAVLLALAVQSYAVKPYEIPSGSMEPTLQIGQRVLVDRFSSRLGADPSIGDVVVFTPPLSAVPEEQDGAPTAECVVRPSERESGQACPAAEPEHADQAFIKRVVAGPGDTIKIINGIPIVNGEKVEGDWTTIPCHHGPNCDYPVPITVPEDSYFMMGDNRPGSDDSRFWGPVPRDWIIGRAVATYWPISRIGGL
jgi:signal peptidase I